MAMGRDRGFGKEPLTGSGRDLYFALAVVMDQIDSAKPTEMIGAIFDGRELERARQVLTEYKDAAYEKGFGRG